MKTGRSFGLILVPFFGSAERKFWVWGAASRQLGDSLDGPDVALEP